MLCHAKSSEAVKELAQEADVVIVLGSQNSSNSQRLRELATEMGKRAYLIDQAGEIKPDMVARWRPRCGHCWRKRSRRSVQECLRVLRERFQATVHNRVIREEHVHFPLPRELRRISSST